MVERSLELLMPRQIFSLADIAQIDGGQHAKIFDKAMQDLSSDCYNRDNDPKPRKLILEISLCPVQDADGDFDHVDVTMDWKTVRPTIKSNVYSMKPQITVSGSKGLLFNPDLPDDPEGKSIADIAEEEEQKRK